MIRTVLISVLSAFSYLSAVLAQDRPQQIPQLAISDRLKAYADEKSIVESATGIIDLLAAGDFEKEKSGFDPPCESPADEAFYRGMHLTHLGYYLFISKQEIGWFEDRSPTQSTPIRAFVDFGRSSLLRVWGSDRVIGLLSATTDAVKLKPNQRADIVVFLQRLREFRQYYRQLKMASGQLDALYAKLNSNSTLRHWRLFLPEDGIAGLEKAFPNMKPFNFDAELRDLVNRVRGAGQPPLHQCLEAGIGYRFKLGEERNITSEKFLLPIFYMVRFWDRRDAEGTSDLTEFILERAAKALASAQQ